MKLWEWNNDEVFYNPGWLPWTIHSALRNAWTDESHELIGKFEDVNNNMEKQLFISWMEKIRENPQQSFNLSDALWVWSGISGLTFENWEFGIAYPYDEDGKIDKLNSDELEKLEYSIRRMHQAILWWLPAETSISYLQTTNEDWESFISGFISNKTPWETSKRVEEILWNGP